MWEILGGLLLGTAASGILPLVNAELLVVGVGVRFGNPLGPSPSNVVRRNHNKTAVFDDPIAYPGGINFSGHNFARHDMMFGVEC